MNNKNKRIEVDEDILQFYLNIVNEKTVENVKNILYEFWLLDASEYSIIKDLIKSEIERLEQELKEDENDPRKRNQEDQRIYNESKRLRDFYIVMKEKVDYIISKGLCKK